MYKEYGLLVKGKMISMISCFIVSLILMGVFGFYSFFQIIKEVKIDSQLSTFEVKENCRKEKKEVVCNPEFLYNVDGNQFVCTDLGNFSKSEIEEIKIIYYDKENPSFCSANYKEINPVLLYLLFVFSIFLFIIMFISFIKSVRHYLLYKRVLKKSKLFKKVRCSIEKKRKIFLGYWQVVISCEISINDDIKQEITVNRYISEQDCLVKTVDVLVNLDDTNLYVVDFNIV